MTRPPLPYRVLSGAIRALLPAAGWCNPRLAQGLLGREETARVLAAWARREDPPAAPLVHLHAASAGELRHAEPVLARLRQLHPDWRWAITWFSPSAIPFAADLAADFHGYLPWDTPQEVSRFLGALRPRATLVSRLDLWPTFAAEAARRGIPVVLIAAQLEADSGRLHPVARTTMRRAYGSVAAAAAVAPEDQGRLARLGVPQERIAVAGDPRADQVRDLVAAARPAERWPALAGSGALLVAGSTWPGDEAVLLEAFRLIRARQPTARLLIAPHQPEPARLRALAARAQGLGLPRTVPVGQAAAGDPLVVLDEVGPLAALYGVGRMAYVGGGFGTAGLHSVLEPAAWGLPVVVGPRWSGSREAKSLAVAGALFPLPARGAALALAWQWERWLHEETARATAGAAARAVVNAAAGAADRTAALVEAALAGYGPTTTPS